MAQKGLVHPYPVVQVIVLYLAVSWLIVYYICPYKTSLAKDFPLPISLFRSGIGSHIGIIECGMDSGASHLEGVVALHLFSIKLRLTARVVKGYPRPMWIRLAHRIFTFKVSL